MDNLQKMSAEQFSKRLVNLCLRSGLAGMPKDDADQQILLKSAVLLLPVSGTLSEQAVNQKLQLWLTQVCVIKNFDRVTLRRCLVDAGYLTRSSDGTSYQVVQSGPYPERFDPSVDQIDILGILQAAREEQERRKQAFLEKSRGA
jgi:hypothetical protein